MRREVLIYVNDRDQLEIDWAYLASWLHRVAPDIPPGPTMALQALQVILNQIGRSIETPS